MKLFHKLHQNTAGKNYKAAVGKLLKEKIMSSNKFCTKCGQKLNAEAKFCNNCGNQVDSSLSSKKEKVLGNEPASKFKLVNIVLAVAFVGAILIYFSTTQTKEEKVISDQPEVMESNSYPPGNFTMKAVNAVNQDGNIVISLDDVKQHKFVSFTYQGQTGSVPLLAYINEDGQVVTAVRMCEPCNSESFHINGDQLICDACGTTWEINNLNAISGSCGKYPPDPIPSKVVGNEIRINENSVIGWSRRI